MMLLTALLLARALFAAETAPAPVANTADGLTEKIHTAALDWFDTYLKQNKPDELVPIAEAIADRLIAGGSLYVAGDPAFCDEWNFRAGGLAGTKIYCGQRMEANDVLIIGLLSAEDKGSRYFSDGPVVGGYGNLTQALAVHIGSQQWPQVSRLSEMVPKARWKSGFYFLDTQAPEGNSWDAVALGQMSSLAVAWALDAEIIAAVSRKGMTAAVLGSIFEPGASEYDEKIKGKSILDEPKLQPIAAGKLSREYLTICRRQVAAFLESGQAQQLRAAAARVADCQKRKGVIWAVTEGHVHARGAIVPGELTRLVVAGPSWMWEPPQGLKAGDLLLFIGYLKFPTEAVDKSLKAGADAAVVVVDDGPNDEHVTTVRSSWEKWDGVVSVPGYPFKAVPSSAILTTLHWYSIMAEALAVLKK
jgi:hypothetical protein